jgi:alpha-beta hydrolase superfamily lysophospholipase
MPEPSAAAETSLPQLSAHAGRRRQPWRRSLARLLACLALGGLGGCALLDRPQRQWIFQPGTHAHPARVGAAAGLEEVWIDLPGGHGSLHALWLPQPAPDAPQMLYLHGARWDIRSSAARMRRMQSLGFSVLGIDYRGFGSSTMLLPSEASVHADARAAWEWLRARQPGARRFIYGHSLGGAIGVRLAGAEPDAAGLIVEGGFTSIADVFTTFRWGWLPARPFITQPFDAARQIAGLRLPVLVVHGERDRMVPPALGRALYERANEPKRFVLVPHAQHHDTDELGQAQYRQALAEFFGLGGAVPGPTLSAGVVQFRDE